MLETGQMVKDAGSGRPAAARSIALGALQLGSTGGMSALSKAARAWLACPIGKQLMAIEAGEDEGPRRTTPVATQIPGADTAGVPVRVRLEP